MAPDAPPWVRGGGPWWCGAAALAVAALGCAGSRPRRSACLAAAFLLAWLHASSCATQAPPRPGMVESEIDGRLLRAAEPGIDGERILRLRRNTETGYQTIRLRVPGAGDGSPSHLDDLRRGDRVRVWAKHGVPAAFGNPGAHDPAQSLRAAGLDAVGRVKSARLVEPLSAGSGGIGRLLDELAVRLRCRLDRVARPGSRERALLGAMLLGDRAAVPEDVERALRDAGMVHLLAISGLHVSFLLLAIRAGARRRLRGLAGTLALLAALGAVAFVVGARPPVLRAVGTGGLGLFGVVLGRRSDPLNALAGAAAVLAVLAPASVRSPSYQLTFLATAGILLLAGPISVAVPGPRAIARGLGVAIAAYLATAPVVAWHFGRVAPGGIVTNVAGAPLCAVVLAGGTAAAMSVDVPLAGGLAAATSRAACRGLLAYSTAAGSRLGGTMPVRRPPAWLALLYYAALGLGRRAQPGAAARALAGGVAAVALVGVHVGPPPPGSAVPGRVAVPDVGQGQSVVLVSSRGAVVLVDAGARHRGGFDAGESVVVPALVAEGIRRVDLLVLTHGDSDHAGGALSVIRDLEIGEILTGPRARARNVSRAAIDAVRKRGGVWSISLAGRRAELRGLSIEMLHPGPGDAALSGNDRSLALRFRGDPECGAILVVGDLERAGERRLLARRADIRAEVLVVGHHGAEDSSGARFLARTQPRWALISAGRSNRYGHPHRDALRRLEAAGARILRTDRDGRIDLVCRGGRGFVHELERHRHERRHEQTQQ